MHQVFSRHVWLFTVAIALCKVAAANDLVQLENAAVQSAIKTAGPSVVQVQTVGGLDRLGTSLLGAGPTTGTIVSTDGYIVSSAYNFIQKPASILVTLPDGKRLPAKMVARDHSRMLVLLKVDAQDLAPAEAATKASLRVGQTAIAMGRSFAVKRANISVGIISAVDRIWGKAIQTDAKISPNNYGGPLVDLHGRVQGILVPLNPQQSAATAGAEWYDGGIGFAVPLEDVVSAVERMKKGEDLHAGKLGITLAGGRDLFGKPPVIASARPLSPAAKAGIIKGDRIVNVDGKPITMLAQLRHALAPRYAGENVKITVLRGKERKTVTIPLIAKLEPYAHPFLGILPRRASGLTTVRYIYPDSPAATAGLKLGDTIVSANNEKIADADALRELLNTLSPDDVVSLEIRRNSEQLKIKAKLASLPEEIPISPAPESPTDNKETAGRVDVAIPEFPHKCFAYIPRGYDTARPHGLIVWLHPPGGHDERKLIARWQPLCENWNLILLAPRSLNPAKWAPSDAAFVRKAMDRVMGQYAIDKTRVVVHGHEGGGALAWLLAISQRDVVRGVAVVDAAIPARATAPENEPLERLAAYVAFGSKSTVASRVRKTISEMRSNKFPVTVVEQGELSRYLRAAELDELCRWIDSLDRI